MNMLAPGDPQPFRLRIEDYELLDRAGVFAGQRVELIEGVLVEMSPQLRRHSFAKNEVTYRLRLALEAMGSTFTAQSEPTLSLDRNSMPEPDVAITNEPRGTGYVPSASVALVVEISDSSVSWDLGGKRAIYAAAAIPEYWVIDLPAARLHRFWLPDGSDYAQADDHPLAGELRSATLPGLAIDGAAIL